MKIGILTFHSSINYGGVLQAVGLQEKLKELGHEPQIINYSIFKKIRFYQGLGIRDHGIAHFIKNINYFLTRKINFILKQTNFNKFSRENLNLSASIHSKKQLSAVIEKFDIVIVGSDQVWNYYITNNEFHPEFFLNFVNCTKISYAASIGVDQPNIHYHEIKKYLSDFKAISVRDDLSLNFVNKLTDIKASLVCDPTFFISYDKFIKHQFKSGKLEKKYFLVYAFNKMDGFEKIIATIKKELGIQTVIIGTDEYNKVADLTVESCSIEDWLYLFKNASFIFTHSFHGVIFSLKNNIEFLAYKYSSENVINERVIDLGRRYNFSERIVNNSNEHEINNIIKIQINYSIVNQKIINHINESINFLTSNLN